MQVEQIRVTDIIKKDPAREAEGLFSGSSAETAGKVKPKELRTIRIDNPFYCKDSLKQETVAETLEQQLAQGGDAMMRHNEMAVYSQTTSDEDFAKMQEEGFHPMEMEAHTIVTVTDRIKAALIKGGADVSDMGGISDEVLDAIAGNSLQANQMKAALKELDLPMDEELMDEAVTAGIKAEQLPEQLSADSIRYLVEHRMAPTIGNLYQASYAAGPAEYHGEGDSAAFSVTGELPQELQKAFEDVIMEAGLEVNEDSLTKCQWMMEQKLPVTAENLGYLNQLASMELKYSSEDTAELVADAVAQGRRPEDAGLQQDDDLMARARRVLDHVWEEPSEQALSDIRARRTVEEARLLMSVQANYQLLKKGIAIDLMPIEDVVEELKQQEEAYLREMLAGKTPEETGRNTEVYREFFGQLEEFSGMPAAALGRAVSVTEMTLEGAVSAARPVKQALDEAGARYDAMRTEVRRDLGDSIQKAFGNVDDILADLGMEQTRENERAVRILAYNERALTEENISQVKAQDLQVQKLFSSMKPAAVMEMIREGKNPLDLSITDLTDMAQEFGERNEGAREEDFAAFLWKLEHTGEVTPEQRESYIGIYRLIHQVEKTDGAAIGALLAQEVPVTLRNLMTAVRSQKHSGREYAIDDSFGETVSFEKEALSITQQIEMAYQTDCLTEAGREMTPVRMAQYEKSEGYLEMTPEQFLESQRQLGEDPGVVRQEAALEQAYAKETGRQVRAALASEEGVYEILDKFDLPVTPGFLEGITEMLADTNQMYRSLNRYALRQEEESATDISKVIAELIKDFGEAVKTPEEMARAQHKLEETAENVMKNMLVEEDVTSIDVRGMKLVTTQIKALGKMAEENEVYHVPILVEDQVGQLSLKIVRGTDQKGLVDVALDMDETGVIQCSFRYEADGITGKLSFDRYATKELAASHMQQLAEAMTEETGLPVKFSFAWDDTLSPVSFYREDGKEAAVGKEAFTVTKEQEPVTTRVLYGVARSFLHTVTDVIFG